jgi:LPS export ABC transporter protein LptC
MKRFIIVLTVFFSAAWLILQISSQNNTATAPAHTQYLEWFGKNITLTEMDARGHIKQTIKANNLRHYVPGEMTDLSNVNIQFFSDTDGQQWYLTSDKGRIFHGENKQDIIRLDLWQHVQLLRPADESQDAVTINTSTLAIFPEEEYAHTDQYTIVKQPGQQISGNGMEVFFPTQNFHLLNNVSSTHENES